MGQGDAEYVGFRPIVGSADLGHCSRHLTALRLDSGLAAPTPFLAPVTKSYGGVLCKFGRGHSRDQLPYGRATGTQSTTNIHVVIVSLGGLGMGIYDITRPEAPREVTLY